MVKPHLKDGSDSVIIADDSVQDKRYSKFIELVKKQYSGNEHGTVRGINLVNFVHSAGNDGDFFPIDYRIYHPDTDGQTKNEHFREMFLNLSQKNLQTRTILFDSWYASVENLKLIHRQNWIFYTSLKSNRLISLSRESGYQSLESLDFESQKWIEGVSVKLKEMPFCVKLFKMVSPNGNIEWIISHDLSDSVNVFVAELKNDNRWQIEEFHRAFKQLTGSEKCQCRKAQAQRNHLACCYEVWLNLKLQAKKLGKSLYQIRQDIFAQFLRNSLKNPHFQVCF